MAEIVLGIGCAHTPQLHTPAQDWDIRAKLDEADGVPLFFEGKKMSYDAALTARRARGFAPTISPQEAENNLRRAHLHIDRLAKIYFESKSDIMVIFGNDQEEIFSDEINPAFAILGAAEFESEPRTEPQKSRLPPGIAIADPGHLPDASTRYPGEAELAMHLVEKLISADFDVAFSTAQPRVAADKSVMSGMPHAYGFIYKQIMREYVIPHVPIVTNTFFPPNQPKASRCLKFGRLVGRAIKEWRSDKRVCLVASGGLSHFLVDADWDADFMDGLVDGELDRLARIPESYFQAGSSECKSWLQLGGALECSGLQPEILDYVPLYRTPAGTGSSCGFMVWQ